MKTKELIGCGWIALVLIVAPVLLFLQPTIPQDQLYHQFADQRSLFGIPNFWDVMSNAPFTVFGLMGLVALASPGKLQILDSIKPAYTIFFLGVSLVGFGSGYYHLNPNNLTLVWDRLPMTIAFMAFVSIVVAEHRSVTLAKWMLLPLLLLGFGSVIYWWWTEQQDAGDLRWYAVVQFMPMLIIPALLICFRSRFDSCRGYWWLLAAYLHAKFLEHFDRAIFECLGGFSGHTLKHTAAALGVLLLYFGYRNRRLQSENPAGPGIQPQS